MSSVDDFSGRPDAAADLLRSERPVLPDASYTRVRARVVGRARPRARRITVAALCTALGIVFGTAGTGLAISGFASGTTAVDAQYSVPVSTPNTSSSKSPTPSEGNANSKGEGESGAAPTLGGGGNGGGGGGEGAGAVKGENEQVTPAQELETVAGGSSGLPFTGFAALPVLALGLAMLGAGLVLRRRTRSSSLL